MQNCRYRQLTVKLQVDFPQLGVLVPLAPVVKGQWQSFLTFQVWSLYKRWWLITPLAAVEALMAETAQMSRVRTQWGGLKCQLNRCKGQHGQLKWQKSVQRGDSQIGDDRRSWCSRLSGNNCTSLYPELLLGHCQPDASFLCFNQHHSFRHQLQETLVICFNKKKSTAKPEWFHSRPSHWSPLFCTTASSGPLSSHPNYSQALLPCLLVRLL